MWVGPNLHRSPTNAIVYIAGEGEGGDGDIAGDVASTGRGQTGKTVRITCKFGLFPSS